MTCADLRPLISAYVDDEVGPAQREMLALHLERCQTCQTYLIAHQRARDLLMTCRGTGRTPDLRAAVRARLIDEQGTRLVRGRTVHRLYHGLWRIAGPGRVVLVALACFLAGRMSALPSMPQAAGPVGVGSGLSRCAQPQPSPSPAGGARGPRVTASALPSSHHMIMVVPCPAPTQTGAVLVVEDFVSGSPGSPQPPLAVHRCGDMQCVQQVVRAAFGPGVHDATPSVAPRPTGNEQPWSRRGLPQML